MKHLNFALFEQLSKQIPCKNVVRLNRTMRSMSQADLVEYHPPDWAKHLKNIPKLKIKVGMNSFSNRLWRIDLRLFSSV